MIRFLCLLLFCIPVAAQTIAPSQIKPGAENQVLTTIDGKGSWGTPTPSGVGTFNGRAGTVLPLTGDYACSMVTGAICTLPSLYNQTVQVSGTPATQEPSLNFIPGISGGPAGISCVDNSAAHSTDCTFSLGGGGGAPVCNLHGCYAVLATGTLIQWGTISGCGGGIHACNVPVFFPNAFSSTSGLSVSITEQGGGTNNFNATAAGVTPSGFYAQFASLVYTGGSGIDLNGTQTATWIAIGPGTGTGGPSAGGVLSINGVGGDFTFSGGGVSCSGTTCTFSSGSFTAGGDLSGSSSSQSVIGLKGVPFCSGFTPTNGQFIELTTGGSPNPCYTATSASGSGNTTSTSLSTNHLPKANGANSIIDSSISDNGATVSTTEPLTVPAVNTVINAGSSLSAAITACGSAQTTIQITQIIAVGTGITVPANCTLLFQSAGNLTGTSITINAPVQAARRQVFGSGLTVTFGPLITEAPIEWFGGKADATGSVGVGTDNLVPFNAANVALSAGCITFVAGGYRFSGTPTFTKPNMCMSGITLGYPGVGIPSNGTNIFIDSASANGPRFTSTATYGQIYHLAVLRTQTATGTARGVSVEAYGVQVHDMASQDSVNNVYYINAATAAQGITENVSTGWGNTGLAGTPGVPVCGFYVDSAGGAVNASIRFLYDQASSNLGGAGTTTGLCAVGTNISDMSINHFESAQTNFGIDLENTGTSNFVAQDIQINDSILNGCLTACLKINGAQSTADIAPHVSVHGGNFFPTGANAVGALIQNSSNVGISGVQIFAGGSSVLDISLNGVDGFTVTNNMIDDLDFSNGTGISCLNSTHGAINDNQIKKATSGTGIKNVGCTLVTEQGNSIAGNGGTPLGTGISFDSASSNNGPWSLNNIDSATVTTPVSDAGTNNNPALVAGANITITGTWPNQTIAAAASGTGISGATAGQALIAGSATTATSSKALAGAGAGVVTGPTSATATDIPVYTSTTGGQVDSGVAIASLAPLASPTFTGTVSAPTIVATTNLLSPSFVAPASGTATSGANFGSGAYGAFGSYWTGTVSNTDSWSWANILGTGANPTSTLTFAHTGSTGVAAVAFPGVINLGVAGTSVGGVVMANATSGTVTLKPPTGALGSVTVTVPDATDTLVNLAGAQTLTNKSIASTEITVNPWSCQPGLGDGLNAITAGTYLTSTCRNETGRTVTLTAIRCVADAGSSTCNATNGAGTGLLTGAITGTSTYANGTQSGTTTIASGDFLKITYVADGTSKQIGIDIAGSY